ncbi:AmmeMemoRadiSam system protein A [Acidilobus saccharovorans]|uniref:AmmeMemoRadiSam system protein A n=1 Tax=Acidilobus saccharovorans TaxID=242703 RepID=UPI000A7CEE77|nr:AmmeMemoRadiSam system protein A [Acidilobus saccharovorans]
MSQQPVDPDEVSDALGEELVRIARKSVEYYFENRALMPTPQGLDPLLLRPGAAFVTIETYEGEARSLRGCIGFIEPIKPLVRSVIEVAVEAAFNDPRFMPMERSELDSVTFEVSILSKLEEAPRTPEGRKAFVTIGRDGLVVERGFYRGLLLPEVPVENMWDVETFLSETCIKAGLWPDCWYDEKVKVYRFRTAAWLEEKPKGRVVRRNLVEEYRKALEARGLLTQST